MPNMLRLLEMRELGITNPDHLIKTELTRRSSYLDISKYMDVQRIYDAAINTLDIDTTENRYLLSGGSDGVIVIYDLHNLNDEPKYTYPMVCTAGRSNRYRHKQSVETVQWFPIDTGMFLSSGADKILKVWDTNTLKTADEFEFSSIIYCHHMSQVARNHSLVGVACQSAKLKLIDLKTGSASHTLRGHKEPVFCCQWSPKEEYVIASGGADSKVMLWDIRSSKGCLKELKPSKNKEREPDQKHLKKGKKKQKLEDNSEETAHSGIVNGLCFLDDGLQLVTTATDNRIKLWNLISGDQSPVTFGKTFNQNHKCTKITVSRGCNRQMIFMPSESDIKVYDSITGLCVNILQGHYNKVNGCVFDSSDQYLYSCGNDRNILVWTPRTSTVTSYEDHLLEKSLGKSVSKETAIQRRTGTEDAWSSSSDEEDNNS